MMAVSWPIVNAMRTVLPTLAVLIGNSVFASAPADSTGMPGDQFSLQAALDQFKKATNLEAFEKAINEEGNRVNNLDLNGDGKVDYVRVESHKEKDAMAIVLQVAVNKEEAQDVAVIELEKTGEGKAIAQIRGAEELYGPDVFVEPYDEGAGKGNRGPSAPLGEEDLWVSVNVWMWPCVQWCYGPYYDPWISPWYWGFYPVWWNPWACWHWSGWYGYHHNHWNGWYWRTNTCRTMQANIVYGGHRRSSATVRNNMAQGRGGKDVRQGGVQRTDGRTSPTMERQRPTNDRMERPTQERGGSGGRQAKPAKPSKQPTARPGRSTAPRTTSPKPSRNTGGGGSKRQGR